MDEWRFGNMKNCRLRNMEEGGEEVNEQRPNKRLRLSTSPHKELRLNSIEQRSNKVQISLNNYYLTHESKNHKVVIKLISELPEEIVREILIRVTYKSRYKPMCVCKSWNAMVDNHKFYQDRTRFGRYEELISLIQSLDEGQTHHKSLSTQHSRPGQVLTIYDLIQDKREVAASFPTGYCFNFMASRCVSINHKLVFMGLYKQDTDELTKAVLVYNFSSSIWKQGSDMPLFHSSFACAVSPHDGLIYIAGGYNGSKKYIAGEHNGSINAMCYNVEKDNWEILPKMQQIMVQCQGFFNNDKFYVISYYNCDVEIFDTNTRLWTKLKNMWTSGWYPDFFVAAFGTLYYFQDGVNEYDWKENVWREIGHFPSFFEYMSYGGTIWQDKIFLIGSGHVEERFYVFQPPKSETMISERWIQKPTDIYGRAVVAVNVKV